MIAAFHGNGATETVSRSKKQFLLVEPVAKTPYPPLGLMRLATWLRQRYKGCTILDVVGQEIPRGLRQPAAIFLTSLFTWDLEKVVGCIQFYRDMFPGADLHVGGVAASLLPDYIESRTGIIPHKGLLGEAEKCSPDYSLSFKRRNSASLTFASRGCPRRCRFCSVRSVEPEFHVRDDWERDVCKTLPRIVFWDNNWLASSNFSADCTKLRVIGKTVDFNQGLDARLYTEKVAQELATIKLYPIRFAFDNVAMEPHVLRAIRLARKHSGSEIRVYVLYNFEDTPEDFYYRIDLLNRNGALAFPMEYRKVTPSETRFPGLHWNTALLRALKLSLIFYYRRGMITESRKSFLSIYGKNAREFISKLYEIYEYDKKRKKAR